jgi:hypothetical protein
MDRTARGVVIGLGSIVAVCGAVLVWLERNSVAPMDFIERYLGFSPDDGDGSMEVMLVTILGVVTVAWAFHIASK